MKGNGKGYGKGKVKRKGNLKRGVEMENLNANCKWKLKRKTEAMKKGLQGESMREFGQGGRTAYAKSGRELKKEVQGGSLKVNSKGKLKRGIEQCNSQGKLKQTLR